MVTAIPAVLTPVTGSFDPLYKKWWSPLCITIQSRGQRWFLASVVSSTLFCENQVIKAVNFWSKPNNQHLILVVGVITVSIIISDNPLYKLSNSQQLLDYSDFLLYSIPYVQVIIFINTWKLKWAIPNYTPQRSNNNSLEGYDIMTNIEGSSLIFNEFLRSSNRFLGDTTNTTILGLCMINSYFVNHKAANQIFTWTC